MSSLTRNIEACKICADSFAQTQTAHSPRPIVWFEQTPKVRIIGQAPGMRVHKSGLPFDDPSGDRLRDWMGIERDVFYDKTRIAITPMAFCFPGYDAKGADLPPPKICADTWADRVDAELGSVSLTLLVGGYAQQRHLNRKTGVTATVEGWRKHAPLLFPLPHPSWRNTSWLKKNPWFEADLLPVLKSRVAKVLAQPGHNEDPP